MTIFLLISTIAHTLLSEHLEHHTHTHIKTDANMWVQIDRQYPTYSRKKNDNSTKS